MLSPLTLQKSAQVLTLAMVGVGVLVVAWRLEEAERDTVGAKDDERARKDERPSVRKVSMTPALWKKIVKGWNALDEKVNSHGSK